MRISVISFTDQGEKIAEKVKKVLEDQEEVQIFRKPKGGVCSWTKEQFFSNHALVFVGACGIAVRATAPLIKDKLMDCAVLVIDEKGKFVIPVLSGHVGGANELSKRLAVLLGAQAVITTATDVNERFAIDVFAKNNKLKILNKSGIVQISSKILKGDKITVSIENYKSKDKCPNEVELLAYPPKKKVDVLISKDSEIKEKAVLSLRPREYVLGIGCKEGKEEKELEQFIEKVLENENLTWDDVSYVASVDRKKHEKGIVDLCIHKGIEYKTFSVEELKRVEGEFQGSEFVQKIIGVDNVCERSALACCNGKGTLIAGKRAEKGKTLAIAKKQIEIDWKGRTRDET